MMGYTSSQNLPSILEQMFGLRLKEDKSKIQACLTGFERRRRKQAFAEKMKCGGGTGQSQSLGKCAVKIEGRNEKDGCHCPRCC